MSDNSSTSSVTSEGDVNARKKSKVKPPPGKKWTEGWVDFPPYFFTTPFTSSVASEGDVNATIKSIVKHRTK
jgi:hypothetical protein